MVPEDLKGMLIEDLPSGYQSPIYTCPNSMQFDVYSAKEELLGPIDQIDLVRSCKIIEKILLNMYPGGSGMEVCWLINRKYVFEILSSSRSSQVSRLESSVQSMV